MFRKRSLRCTASWSPVSCVHTISSRARVSSSSSLKRDHWESHNGTVSGESVVARNSSYQGFISDQRNCSKNSLERGSGISIDHAFLQTPGCTGIKPAYMVFVGVSSSGKGNWIISYCFFRFSVQNMQASSGKAVIYRNRASTESDATNNKSD